MELITGASALDGSHPTPNRVLSSQPNVQRIKHGIKRRDPKRRSEVTPPKSKTLCFPVRNTPAATRASLPPTAGTARLDSAEKRTHADIRQAFSQRGTRDDPIDLELYSNRPDAVPAGDTRTKQKAQVYHKCPVCRNNFTITELPSLTSCNHPSQTCSSCFATWIEVQLQESGWGEVRCPDSRCKVKLTYHEIQTIAPAYVFNRYDELVTRNALNKDPNFRWCRNCSSGQIHAEGTIFTCASCKHKVCVIHETVLHEGETCEEYDDRCRAQDQRAQEAASLSTIRKLSKKCPRPNCVYSIEKDDGCDHMTCSKCRYEFCWICLCDYNKVRRLGNSAHIEHCKYHTRHLR